MGRVRHVARMSTGSDAERIAALRNRLEHALARRRTRRSADRLDRSVRRLRKELEALVLRSPRSAEQGFRKRVQR